MNKSKKETTEVQNINTHNESKDDSAVSINTDFSKFQTNPSRETEVRELTRIIKSLNRDNQRVVALAIEVDVIAEVLSEKVADLVQNQKEVKDLIRKWGN